MKTLFVHCGLHETGSKALQKALFSNQFELRKQGFHFPQAGIEQGRFGHDNIAWQMARDRRFRPDVGDMTKLFTELLAAEGPAIVSSEDFEASLPYPQRWGGLVNRAAALGFSVKLVIYLRDVSDYLVSLYLEAVRRREGEEFQRVLEAALRYGLWSVREMDFCFNYDNLRRAAAAIEGVSIEWRNFDKLVGGSPVTDFCAVAGIDESRLDYQRGGGEDRVGASDLLAEFVTTRMQLNRADASTIREIADLAVDGRDVQFVLPANVADIVRARLPSGLEPPPKPVGTATRVNVLRAFSLETQVNFSNFLAALIQQSEFGDIPDVATLRPQIEQWWGWACDGL